MELFSNSIFQRKMQVCFFFTGVFVLKVENVIAVAFQSSMNEINMFSFTMLIFLAAESFKDSELSTIHSVCAVCRVDGLFCTSHV